jgi:hypothetical protein
MGQGIQVARIELMDAEIEGERRVKVAGVLQRLGMAV